MSSKQSYAVNNEYIYVLCMRYLCIFAQFTTRLRYLRCVPIFKITKGLVWFDESHNCAYIIRQKRSKPIAACRHGTSVLSTDMAIFLSCSLFD